MTDALIAGACHCGAVRFDVRPNGQFLVECNCSICQRLGVIWLHAPPATVTVTAPEGSTISYTRSDAEADGGIAFHSCRTCGCTTHYQGQGVAQMAVNMRLADPEDMAALDIRHWDGAHSWDWLD